MTNVVVSRKRSVQISANATAGIIDTSTPVVLKNNPSIGLGIDGGVTRLDRLRDVVANAEVNGATLVYNSSNDTYVVKKLDISDVTGAIDGGIF
jgi:hypothetical protein